MNLIYSYLSQDMQVPTVRLTFSPFLDRPPNASNNVRW